jgi:hypothetical protein
MNIVSKIRQAGALSISILEYLTYIFDRRSVIGGYMKSGTGDWIRVCVVIEVNSEL